VLSLRGETSIHEWLVAKRAMSRGRERGETREEKGGERRMKQKFGGVFGAEKGGFLWEGGTIAPTRDVLAGGIVPWKESEG